MHVADQTGHQYTDGICLAELSGLRDPELLPHMVAAGLGLVRRAARPALDSILDYLRERRLLLILDTCDHVIEACGMFAETVLREAAGVTILATSRQPLDVAGEHTYRLAPPRADDPSRRGQRAGLPETPGQLTRRESQVAELVASGLSNREVASRLFISKRTVDAHVDHIFTKLDLSSRVHLALLLRARIPRPRAGETHGEEPDAGGQSADEPGERA
jgi:predicted ATPase